MDLLKDSNKYCSKKYAPSEEDRELSEKDEEELAYFCKLLHANKKKDSTISFFKLPKYVQCLFLEVGQHILLNRELFPEESYQIAFTLYKNFRGKDYQAEKIYKKYSKSENKEIEKAYAEADKWNKDKKPKKNLTKKYQKHEAPSEGDALYLFYTSLRKENPKSKLAITWLTEHGLLEGEERKKLEKEYAKLAERKELVH
jgi:hypothetical protein